ncbi:MAG: hypothetical protein NT019_00510 [Candidatus Adlerbacteria bacterium]|nr:hypothetical protein [Candidatus Adlerbacteria bacterium]
MNTKDSLTMPLLFICAFLLAGSCVVNMLQFQQAQNLSVKKAQTNLLLKIPDVQRIATIVKNNFDERWVRISYTDGEGQTEQLQAWVTSATVIQRTQAGAVSGVTERASVEDIDQKDLRVGEPIYIIMRNSSDQQRLEASRITVGDLLPVSL